MTKTRHKIRNNINKKFKKYENDFKSDYIKNELIKFIEYTYSYSKITLNKYSCGYSKHTYTQQALFTIIH